MEEILFFFIQIFEHGQQGVLQSRDSPSAAASLNGFNVFTLLSQFVFFILGIYPYFKQLSPLTKEEGSSSGRGLSSPPLHIELNSVTFELFQREAVAVSIAS